MKLKTDKLRDLAGSLRVLESKSLELVPILDDLARPLIDGNAIRADQFKWRSEGGVDALKIEFAALQLALNDARKRISPAIKALKNSLQ